MRGPDDGGRHKVPSPSVDAPFRRLAQHLFEAVSCSPRVVEALDARVPQADPPNVRDGWEADFTIKETRLRLGQAASAVLAAL